MSAYSVARPTKFCSNCGSTIDAAAEICPRCGVRQSAAPQQPAMREPVLYEVEISEKRIVPAGLLCFFFGVFGVHRFYVGKVGTGILQLLTLGGLGVWWMIDLIMIIAGAFTDRDGNKVKEWI